MVPIIASHRRRLLQFLVFPLLPHLHEFFFQFLEQNMYWNIDPLRNARIFLSNESSFAQNWFRTRDLCPFIPALQSVPTNFRTRNIQCSCHISLYGSSNLLILDALEWEFHGASEYQLFLPCTSLSMCKIDENSGACSQTLEVLTNLISSLITNSWERFVMTAKQSSAHTTPPQGDGRE